MKKTIVTKEPKLIGQLQKWDKNPRAITQNRTQILAKTILEFGDLSGIVYNVRSKKLVGGHMRQEHLAKAKIEIIKRYPKPNKLGTVAFGFAVLGEERFSYREVNWDETKHTAGALAANKGAGEWDVPILKELLQGLEDMDFDMDLTGFDLPELEDILGNISGPKDLDYSALDGESVEDQINQMQGGLRKAIVIEFEMEDYPKAQEMVSMLRTKGVYIGGIFLEFLETTKKLL